MFREGDRPLAGFAGLGLARIVTAQQVHQRRCQLFGGTPWALAFEGMPIPIANRQGALQLLRQVTAVWGPLAGGIHWTRGRCWSHPGVGACQVPLARS